MYVCVCVCIYILRLRIMINRFMECGIEVTVDTHVVDCVAVRN